MLLALVVAVVGLATTTGSAGGAPDRSSASAKAGIPRTYDDALERFQDAVGTVRKMRRFVSPSGNI